MAVKTKLRCFESHANADHGDILRFRTSVMPFFATAAGFEIETWRDDGILPGEIWNDEIQRALDTCDFALLLVSPSFLASEFIAKVEIPHLIASGKPLFPVLLKHVDFERQDLLGLDPHQFFFLRGPRGERKSFDECDAKARARFARELFAAIHDRLRKVFP